MNWIEEAFLRLTNLIKQVMDTAAKRDEEIAQRIIHDEAVIKEGFDQVGRTVTDIHAAFQILTRRIETLEVLAGKELADEMERPRYNTKQGGNA